MRRPELEDPAFAQACIERWLQDERLRKAILTRLGESVHAANAAAPWCWGLSLHIKRRFLRLNVGTIEVFVVHQHGEHYLMVDRSTLPLEGAWAALEDGYKSVPSAVGVWVPSVEFDGAYERLRAGHRMVIHEAARRRPTGYVWKNSHSPGVLRYMSHLLGGSFPEPAYEQERALDGLQAAPAPLSAADVAEAELAAVEGDVRFQFAQHRSREVRLRGAKITEALRRNGGRLVCEVPGCGFDFEATYGPIGVGYAHVHHLQPLGERSVASKTRLRDLAIVCANCHAMIHRHGGCRGLDGLVQGQGK